MSNRDRLVLRYLSALDAGNIDELQAVLAQAESDPQLAAMIVETHGTYEASTFPYSLNGHVNPSAVRADNVIQPSTRKAVRGTRGHWVALVAAALTLLLTSVIISNRPSSDSNLQAEGIPFDRLQPITVDNVDRLTHLATLGTGVAYDVDWSPDGAWFAVSSASGVYIHDADELDAEPTLLGGRSLGISQSALNPDGTILAGVHRNSVMLWNTTTGEVLNVIDTDERWLTSVQFNAEGDQIATVGCAPIDQDNGCQQYIANRVVRLWDLATGEETHSVEIESDQYHIALTPDFTYLAYFTPHAADEPRFIHLIDVASAEVVAEIELPNPGNSSAIAFSSDGSKFVTGGIWQGANLRIFDVNALIEPDPDGEEVITQRGPTFSFTSFLPGDTELLTLGSSGYLTIRDAETGEQIRNVTIDNGYILAAAVDPQLRTFAAVDWSGVVRLFDLDTGDVRRNLLQYGTSFQQLGFGLNDTLLVAGGFVWGGGPARLWDLTDLTAPDQKLFSEATAERITGVAEFAVSPGSTELAYITDTFELRVRDLQTGEDRLLRTRASNLSHLAFTEQGDLILVEPFERLLFQDARPQPELIRIPGINERDNGRSQMGISPDGQLIINGTVECSYQAIDDVDVSGFFCTTTTLDLWANDLQVRLASLEDGQTADMPIVITTSPGNELLAQSTCAELDVQSYGDDGYSVRCEGGEIMVWDIRNLNAGGTTDETNVIPPLVILEGYTQIPIELAFAPTHEDYRHLLATTASNDDYVKFWSIDAENASYRALNALANLDGQEVASGMAFNQSGTLFAVSYAGLVEIWGVVE